MPQIISKIVHKLVEINRKYQLLQEDYLYLTLRHQDISIIHDVSFYTSCVNDFDKMFRYLQFYIHLYNYLYISNTYKQWKTRVSERGCLLMHSSTLQGLLGGRWKEMCTTSLFLIDHIHSRKRLLIFGSTSCYYIQLLKPLELVWEG